MCAKIVCSQCIKYYESLDKARDEIQRLRAENKRLKEKLSIQERKISEGYFGSSTPSSKKPVKKNTVKKDKEKNRGGAVVGHKGNGRSPITKQIADRIEKIELTSPCPHCGSFDFIDLGDIGERERGVVDFEIKVEKVIYELERKKCNGCKKIIQAKAPGVLPKNLYSNNFLAHIATEHYLNGIPLGHLERQTGIGYGALINAMHRLGDILKDVPEKLIEYYRNAKVKHADETGWRRDGNNGYGWLFATPNTCVYRFRDSRSGKIAQAVFGDKELPGVLVVDRYAGYNKAPCDIQYCYAHILRHIQDLEKEFPDNEEIKIFVEKSAPLLAEAMNLRSLPIDDKEFYKRAVSTKEEIIKTMNSEANHAGIQNIQNIFREKHDRLYHWADDRDVPADNNFAERELRGLVVARKISFGSHSDAGVLTREILMSVLKTLKLRTKTNTRIAFKEFLDKLAENPKLDIYQTLFQKQTD